MRRELEEKLFKKYPNIFAGKDKPITESLIPFGLECGNGWEWLIDNLCHSIQGYVDSRNEGVRIRKKAIAKFTFWYKLWYAVGRLLLIRSRNYLLENDKYDEEEWQVEAIQVKEKFGTLRFYINHGDDHIYGMIWLAEVMSAGICEMCGTTADVTPSKGGWIKYLCPKCREERSTYLNTYPKVEIVRSN